VLRTRSPLGFRFPEGRLNLVRLACVKHAASVRPEPGSNSPTKACRRSQRLPRATNDCCRAQDRFGISPQPCDLDMITFCCHRKGIPATELTSSSSQRLAPPPTELPALAFCLLFRFQGAEALRTSATDSAARLGACSSGGVSRPRSGVKHYSQRREATTRDQEKTSTRWCNLRPRCSSR
jgi:hypothetical protein